MKPNTILIVVLAIVIIGIAGFAVLSPREDSQNSRQSASGLESSGTQISPNYVSYSKEALAKAQKDGRAVIFFWAVWCPTCQALDAELKERSSELPSDVTILKTNYDTESELKNKYGIVFQHTLVQVDKDGNEIKKWIGGGIDLLKQQIK